jgi:hypothetical protein
MSFRICFSSKLKTTPPKINMEATSFHMVSSSPRNNAELKNPTTGIISVKGTTAEVEYVLSKNPQAAYPICVDI